MVATGGQYREVRLTVIGSSPAWPNPGSAHAGLLVTGPARVLLDCGPGVLPRLRAGAADGSWPQLDAVVITHWHLDHWGDLVPWVWGLTFRPDGGGPRLCVPPGGIERLRTFGAELGRAQMFDDAFDVEEYGERTTFSVGDIEVTPFRVPHYRLQTYALRLSDGERTLCYSGDSGPCDELVEAARDTDLFVCEATLDRGELDGQPRGHLSADEAIDLSRRANARRLLLTHRPVELPVPEGVEVASDGLVIDV